MSVFQCKMCGGQLDVHDGESIATCPYCSTKQTIPKLSDDKVRKILEKANTLRINGEYDKAIEQYERLIEDDTVTDAEIYWNMVLSKYGILYVDDPSEDKVPTVNRTQMTSVFLDDSYKKTIDLADPTTRKMYEDEAKKIDKIQQEILAISKNEKPYDIFICYKESDDKGETTQDSVDAYQIYHNLTNEGYRVFFARVSLEGKVGKYEPYIFSALYSAKVMLVIGSKKEYFEAPWVKNEWMRYLHLMKQDPTKRNMIPCYKGISPYDLPKELTYLQAQNMNNIGFIQDLLRGINKVFHRETEAKGYSNLTGKIKDFNTKDAINKLKQTKPTDIISFVKLHKKIAGVIAAALIAIVGFNFIFAPKTYSINSANKAKTVIEYSKDTLFTKMDTVKFGKYPQKDKRGINKDTIEWFVLEKTNSEIVLLSKYVLDNKLFNLERSCTYKDSYIRNWLNNEFVDLAFTDDDRKHMLKIEDDYVGLMSRNQFDKNFGAGDNHGDNIKACTEPTSYAKEVINDGQLLFTVHGGGHFGGNCSYWLNSFNGTESGSSTDVVSGRGSVGQGYPVNQNPMHAGVRPVVKIKLK